MRSKKIILPVILTAFIFTLAFSLQAQDDSKKFTGNFSIGYRSVDTDGALSKYKEDINLTDGVRLFNFNLHYSPGEKLQNLFDSLDLRMYNLGGDPFETFSLSVQKYGAYTFQYDRKKSTYFYEDMFEAGGSLYDLHSFDFDRISDSGSLKVTLHKNADVYFNFDKYTKEGESITTFDLNRIEFEFDKPIREESKSIAVGVDLHMKGYSLLAEGKWMEYSNDNSLFLPGFEDGGDSARYPCSMSMFVLNQPYDFKTNTYTVKINANPITDLLVSGSAQFNTQDMNLRFSESADGIDYLGRSFEYGYTGTGTFERKFNLIEGDLSYILFSKLAVIGSVRYHDFEQTGSMTIENTSKDSDFNYDTLGIEGGLQYQFSSKFALTAGYRYEIRELENLETVEYETDTSRNGFFGNLKADLFKGFKLTMDYQYGNYENPYTLIGPTGFTRFRATAKYLKNGFNASASYLMNKAESEAFGDTAWESHKNQLNLRLGYSAEAFRISGGYAYIDVEHKGDRLIAYAPAWSGGPGTFTWDILYEGKSSLLDLSGSLSLMDGLNAGAYFNSYKNTGFWEIHRSMLKGYLEYMFDSGIVAQLAFRHVNFEEADSGLNDYKANILEISFGYRWK
jgi:hypothetical protein